jgi:hypothetical protein
MKQTTKRLVSTLFALLLLVIAAIAFFELVQPEYTNLMALKGQAVGEKQLLVNEQKIVAQVQSVLSTYQSQSSGTQAVNLAMPIGANNAEALAQLYGLATNSSLAVQSVGISLQNAPQSSGNASSSAALIKPKSSITFQLAANGSYEALKTFLQGLENNVRVFDVTGLSIHPVNAVTNAGVAPASTQDFYTYTITAVAYYQSS